MEDILALAEQLAAKIVANERTNTFREATIALEADAPARELQEEYTVAVEEIRGLEAAGRPVEPAAKRHIQALADRIRKSLVLQRFLKANVEFSQMMDAVQQTLGGLIDAALFPEAGGEHAEHDHAGHSHGPGESCGAGPKDEEPKNKGPILWTP